MYNFSVGLNDIVFFIQTKSSKMVLRVSVWNVVKGCELQFPIGTLGTVFVDASDHVAVELNNQNLYIDFLEQLVEFWYAFWRVLILNHGDSLPQQFK